jgi:two-component system cell cycle response regulator DivK
MANERILIVEDNELNLKLLRDVLQVEGYVTRAAGTAEEGLTLVRGEHPALVLMDIHLPGMDGVAGLRALRADPATAAIPVIAVTASAMPLERAEILAAGFDGCFVKPLDVDEVIVEVRAVLDAAAARAGGSVSR